MAKLTITIGLAGCGKSFWARAQKEANPAIVLVEKDTIRAAFEEKGWARSRDNEKDVLKERDKQIVFALMEGKDVIESSTNLALKHQNRLRQIAIQCMAGFELKDFTDVPVEVCIERDNARVGKARVGRDVIVQMAKTYLGWKEPEPTFAPYIPNGGPNTILCDLDGTISLFGPGTSNLRNPYDASTADKDDLNPAVAACLFAMIAQDYEVIFLSGREDQYRPQTETFLAKHDLNGFPLFMRKTGDSRKDCIVKRELFDAHIRDQYNVIFILDDRDQVVNFWRSIGLAVFQVAPGAF